MRDPHFVKTPQGTIFAFTGARTGRSVKERFIVKSGSAEREVAWGSGNQSFHPELARILFDGLAGQLSKAPRVRAFAGPFEVEVISPSEWHRLFVRNMFRSEALQVVQAQLRHSPKIIRIWHDPTAKPEDYLPKEKYSGEVLIVLDLDRAEVAIVGSSYAGEIKKSAFTMCNYELPKHGIFPMHASANCLEDGSAASILFGLSGTGKTTLSAVANRYLIGDDEILWSESGLSNLEGGCYAKLIDLSEASEPEIYRAVHSPSAILENVVFDPKTFAVDFKDRSLTENTRGSYPLSALRGVFNQKRESQHPKSIVFLSADAFGALPAVAKLNPDQAEYYFLSGYTAKVAGTEMGVKEPQATFSTCFGAPFMPRAAKEYAAMLKHQIRQSGAEVWMLNTGWTRGGYGKGRRFPIATSRALLEQIQNGTLLKAPREAHPVFGFEVPTQVEGIETDQLDPKDLPAATELAQLFKKNASKQAYPTTGGPK